MDDCSEEDDRSSGAGGDDVKVMTEVDDDANESEMSGCENDDDMPTLEADTNLNWVPGTLMPESKADGCKDDDIIEHGAIGYDDDGVGVIWV